MRNSLRLLIKEKNEIHLLTYHRFGEDKIETIRSKQKYLGIPSMNRTELEDIKKKVQYFNEIIVVGGEY